tara:strand:+ start:650 stop:928 length:279 start_codon:yes stop_codon:yes gene_type:complete
MRLNLTKKDLINLIYMQIGYSKRISEHLIDDFFLLIMDNLQKEKKLKISNFGTFLIRKKNQELEEIQKLKKKKSFLREMLFHLRLQKTLRNL